jgi:hypothetical protein
MGCDIHTRCFKGRTEVDARARRAAQNVWEELSSRSGFGFECLEDEDPETYENIIDAMARVIETECS